MRSNAHRRWISRACCRDVAKRKRTPGRHEEALLPHIFNQFVQAQSVTTRRLGGMGLGLAVVKQLAELHGGAGRAERGGLARGAQAGEAGAY